MPHAFSRPKVRLILAVWRLAWLVLMPLVLGYLAWRGRRDPLYGRHLAERFGFHRRRAAPHIWVHAVSIGELRSAIPLITALLDRGEHVVTTHFTPAGRREAAQVFGQAIARGQLSAVWVPFDYGLAYGRFLRAFRPRAGLVMEVEFWPGMIAACRRRNVPLWPCNSQYPSRSFARDTARAVSPADLLCGYAGAMVKSPLQAERFARLGVEPVVVTGELRFDIPPKPAHLAAAARLRAPWAQGRQVLTLASVVEGEDALMIAAIDAMKAQMGAKAPLVVYVPRAPERFDPVAQMLADAGLRTARRSAVLDAALAGAPLPQVDVLLGDSLGEMFFYLALADRVLVGGGFTPKGSHNIIEPLSLGKEVIVGPQIWTIEFPAQEAIAAGVCHQVDQDGLVPALLAPPRPGAAAAFLAQHRGATGRSLAVLDQITSR